MQAAPGRNCEHGDVVVVAGGDQPDLTCLAQLAAAATVIAADSGLDHARAAGVHADILVGDLDSVTAGSLDAAEAAGTDVRRFPAAKDATDLELALDAAMSLQPRRITVVAGIGGRLDHLLSAALLLAAPRYAAVQMSARIGPATLTVIRAADRLRGVPGELVSLLPVHGPASGVVTTGLRYPLNHEDLAAGSSRGISNCFAEPVAEVRLGAGVLVAVSPGVRPEKEDLL
ncbi:MAG: thiamine diphosphokinase [Mycobacteriales bacterium]|nr:MAG: thiamine diphosphokinase [Pseudonocardiales bacterium]